MAGTSREASFALPGHDAGRVGAEPVRIARNGGTIGFVANSPEQAEAWHAIGLANGATTCEDPPGVREAPVGKFYLAYLRDPDGNKICALHRMG